MIENSLHFRSWPRKSGGQLLAPPYLWHWHTSEAPFHDLLMSKREDLLKKENDEESHGKGRECFSFLIFVPTCLFSQILLFIFSTDFSNKYYLKAFIKIRLSRFLLYVYDLFAFCIIFSKLLFNDLEAFFLYKSLELKNEMIVVLICFIF